jgi:hypothetical protein
MQPLPDFAHAQAENERIGSPWNSRHAGSMKMMLPILRGAQNSPKRVPPGHLLGLGLPRYCSAADWRIFFGMPRPAAPTAGRTLLGKARGLTLGAPLRSRLHRDEGARTNFHFARCEARI